MHSDNSTDAMFMPHAVAAELMSGLCDAGWRLERHGLVQRGPIYELVGCRPIATEDDRQGLALTMKPGFDIVLTLTQNLWLPCGPVFNKPTMI